MSGADIFWARGTGPSPVPERSEPQERMFPGETPYTEDFEVVGIQEGFVKRALKTLKL